MVDLDHPEGGSPTNLSELSRALPVAGLEIEGRYQAADLDVRAGGDFFDVFPLGPERTAVIIGDIAGHGRAAAVRPAGASAASRTGSWLAPPDPRTC